jgi:DNA polymerase I
VLQLKTYRIWTNSRRSSTTDVLAIDTETTGIEWHDVPFCATIAWREDGELKSEFLDLEAGYGGKLRFRMQQADRWVFHNPKFDLQKLLLVGVLERSGLSPDRIEDTEACAHLLDEHQLKGLKFLAEKHLGETLEESDEVKKERRRLKLKKADGYHKLPRDLIVPYALKDAEFTLRLWELLKPQIEASEDLNGLYRHEMELSLVLLDMEARGMGVDLDYVERTAKEYNTRILAQRMLIADMTGDEDFNPNSPKQIAEAFAKLGIELESTDKAHLKHQEHPLAQAILELRSLNKMHGTYLQGIIAGTRDGIIHTGFRQHKPVTGRLASGGVEH